MIIKPSAFIFDLDGTLIDSMGVWKQIDVEYLGRFQIPLPEDLQKNIEGLSFHDTAIYFKEHFPIPDSLEKMKSDWNRMAMHIYANEIMLKPGARRLLNYAKENKIPCGIATSNSLELVDSVLKSNGARQYFDAIICASDVGKSKPAPDVYYKCADKLHAKRERCLVFEDILAGIEGAHNAGMLACAIDDEYSKYQAEEKKAMADYFVADFDEFMDKYI